MSNRRFAETDWVNSAVLEDPSAPAPVSKASILSQQIRDSGFTPLDSAYAIQSGLDVQELDTIPAELMEFFK